MFRYLAALVVFLGSTPLCGSENRAPRGGERGLPQHIEVTAGDVVFHTNGTRILVLVDTRVDKAAPSDGLIDQWFILQTDEPAVPLSAHLRDAMLVHGPGMLRVTTSDERYELLVRRDGNVPEATDAITTRVIGFGLSHNKAESGVRMADMLDRSGRVSAHCEYGCEPFDSDPGGGGTGAATCTAGGTGSTSCSVTNGGNSCSVTCSTGYYACCNYTGPSCRCIRNI